MAMVHEPPPQHLPMTTTQLAGHGLTTIVGGLTPAMLGVLLLNLMGVGAAVYFLDTLIKGTQANFAALLTVQKSQIELVLRTHDREFDAMMGLVKEDRKPLPPVDEPVEPLPMPRP